MCCRYLGVTQDVMKGNNPQSPISKGWINSKQWVPCIWGQFGYLLFWFCCSSTWMQSTAPSKGQDQIPMQFQCRTRRHLGARGGNFHLARVGPTHPARHMGHTTRDSWNFQCLLIITATRHQHPYKNKEKPLSMPPHCKMHYRAHSSSFGSHTTPVAW